MNSRTFTVLSFSCISLMMSMNAGGVISRVVKKVDHDSDRLFHYKDELRSKIMAAGKDKSRFEVNAGLSELSEIGLFFGNFRTEMNVLEFDRRKLRKGIVDRLPWSDSYWPMYLGLAGARYADQGFPASFDWLLNFRYASSRRASNIIASRNRKEIDTLSPAEKYDLLVGDTEWSLTRWSWARGKKYFDQYGTVDAWMGLCHGWASASHMLTQVTRLPVDVPIPNGLRIRFYPSDLRGLLAMLWAEASPQTRFIGKRCREKNPKRDSNGKIYDEKCFDINPGSWHVAIINRIGIQRRSLVIDATFDDEVWNYPVVSYDYSYFDPRNNMKSSNARHSLIKAEEHRNDPFSSYRSNSARFILGVEMKISYTVPVQPHHGTPGRPSIRSTRYRYDLELDDSYAIVGGEWHQVEHPDFLWTHPLGASPVSVGEASEELPGEWRPDRPIPSHWLHAARISSRQGQPLSRIIEALIRAGR